MNHKQGFASIWIIAVSVLFVVVVSGIGYKYYQQKKLTKEEKNIEVSKKRIISKSTCLSVWGREKFYFFPWKDDSIKFASTFESMGKDYTGRGYTLNSKEWDDFKI